MLARTAVTALILGAAAIAGPALAQTPVSPTTPAEIQPGHPPPATTGSTGAPQTVTPTPLPPGAGADTPGGAARNGVIAPPGSPGGNPTVVPK